MSITLRVPRKIHHGLVADLRRPHRFTAERVAFAHATVGNRGEEQGLVLVTEYWSVPDEHYIDDPLSGARIGSAAIHDAMQRILDTGQGVGRSGSPRSRHSRLGEPLRYGRPHARRRFHCLYGEISKGRKTGRLPSSVCAHLDDEALVLQTVEACCRPD